MLSYDELAKLMVDKTVQGGMLVKAQAIMNALNKNLDHIHVLNGGTPHVVIKELFTEKDVGTLCVRTKRLNLEAVA